jgi:periplasmic divalent cation tolerance protein
MSDVLLVLCSFPNSEQARQIGTAMVERQLAACVNLVPGMESIYRWQGAVESATEILAVFKTTVGGYPALAGALGDAHPYEVPEIIALAPAEIAATYATWVLSNVAAQDR